jgi:predicted dehydrogenase
MRIALVGCGYVADLYMSTLGLHPELELAGVLDRDPERVQRFARHHSVHEYRTLEELLADETVQIVVNLTPPQAHFEVSSACLKAGRHVYSEKPLALDQAQAVELVELAERRGLRISCAPSRFLGEAAQTVWKALREKRVGKVLLAYAEMDDGLLHRMPYRRWRSASGAPWPHQSEFETGCTLEHAAYAVTCLAAFFGPARSVTAFSSVQIPDKCVEAPLERSAPDLSVACIRFDSGIVARLTCSIIAPRDHSLRIIGDRGVLSVADTWLYRSPVYLQRWLRIRRRTFLNPWRRKIRLLQRQIPQTPLRRPPQTDLLDGVAELAQSVAEGRASRISERFSLHVNEVVLAIHNATEAGSTREFSSSFDPIEPMPWAAS